jgi:ribonucleoside-triphosphate reductase
VQNWNDGKSQEYKDRKVYKPSSSVLRQVAQAVQTPAPEAPVCEEVAPAQVKAVDGKLMLFSRVTCPNCRVVEGLLTKANIPFQKLIADENLDLCRELGVKGAPTLVVTDGEHYESFYGVPEIKKYLASR